MENTHEKTSNKSVYIIIYLCIHTWYANTTEKY